VGRKEALGDGVVPTFAGGAHALMLHAPPCRLPSAVVPRTVGAGTFSQNWGARQFPDAHMLRDL
jgi:hypothetical protein